MSGALGVVYGDSNWFLSYTPATLLLNFLLLIIFHEGRKMKLLYFITIVLVAGYIIEMLGTNTGLIFGVYNYGAILGTKIANTPIIIGANWFILCYSCYSIFSQKIKSVPVLLLCSSACVCLIDILIEPVAIRYGFWHWQAGFVPIKNYIAWFVFALLFNILQHRIIGPTKNKMAIWILIGQILFFGLILLI